MNEAVLANAMFKNKLRVSLNHNRSKGLRTEIAQVHIMQWKNVSGCKFAMGSAN